MAATAQNHLIELLPAPERRRLLGACAPVVLRLGEVLSEAGTPLRHAYFPVDGFISLLTRIEQHPSLEVGMAGREGCWGAWLALGSRSSALQALVQGPGSAWRIEASALRARLGPGTVLQQVLLRYQFVVMEQLGSSAACLRFHLIGPRLARWLLMSRDRAHEASFHVTHEFLASMLGVRRVGVTVAASDLQRRGLIRYHRGELTVLDRAGLEAAACPCYARQSRAYDDGLKPRRRLARARAAESAT